MVQGPTLIRQNFSRQNCLNLMLLNRLSRALYEIPSTQKTNIYKYIYIYIYIYIYVLKTMKVFFAFALRVSSLLRLFRHSKVFLLTYYVTDVIVITIIMALVIRSTREQLA